MILDASSLLVTMAINWLLCCYGVFIFQSTFTNIRWSSLTYNLSTPCTSTLSMSWCNRKSYYYFATAHNIVPLSAWNLYFFQSIFTHINWSSGIRNDLSTLCIIPWKQSQKEEQLTISKRNDFAATDPWFFFRRRGDWVFWDRVSCSPG